MILSVAGSSKLRASRKTASELVFEKKKKKIRHFKQKLKNMKV